MEQKNHGSPSFINIAALFIFAVVIAVASTATTYFFLSSRSNEQYSAAQPPIVSPPQTYIQPTSPPAQQTQTGFIEGELSFPSQGIPTDAKVCAINSSKQEYCTKSDISKYGKYHLEVPAGNYYVFARVPSVKYKAYYTEAVTCQLSPPTNCPSHQPIIVEVITGKTISNIDPDDFQEYFEDSFLAPLK